MYIFHKMSTDSGGMSGQLMKNMERRSELAEDT